MDKAQVQTYLKLLNCHIGLILNFNTRWLKNGIHRIINPGLNSEENALNAGIILR